MLRFIIRASCSSVNLRIRWVWEMHLDVSDVEGGEAERAGK